MFSAKRVEVIDWKAFARGEYRKPTFGDEVVAYFKRNKLTYQVVGSALIVYMGCGFDYAYADTGIDAGAKQIYWKLINVGKWVIIVKGGIETIKSAADGDFQSVRKGFLGYGITYAVLWALPWMMDEIEKIFKGMVES